MIRPTGTHIGIDPGASGAIAYFRDGSFAAVLDYEDPIAMRVLAELSLGVFGPTYVLIERVHAFPGQGVSSVFKFGQNFGQWIGRLEAFRLSYDFVAPKRWQKWAFGAAPKIMKNGKLDTKSMSIERARRIYPEAAQYLTRKKDEGRADAINIADYCMRGGFYGNSTKK